MINSNFKPCVTTPQAISSTRLTPQQMNGLRPNSDLSNVDDIKNLNFKIRHSSELIKHFEVKKPAMRLLSLNVQSFNNGKKVSELDLLVLSMQIKFDILGITETWHNDVRCAPCLTGYKN